MRPLAAAALLALAARASAELKPRAFLGISTATASAVPAMPAGETRTFPSALEIVFVVPDGPAERAGLREGDLVLAIDSRVFDPKDGDPAVAWRRHLETLAPGGEVTLTVLRRGVVTRASRDGVEVADPDAFLGGLSAAIAGLPPGGVVSVEARRTERTEDLKLTLARHPLDATSPLRLDVSTHEAWPVHGALVNAACRHANTTEAWTALEEALGSVAASDDPVRLPVVRRGLARPAEWPQTSEQAARAATHRWQRDPPIPAIRGSAQACGLTVAAFTAGAWDLPENRATAEALPPASTPAQLAEVVAERLRLAALNRERALSSLSASDRAFVAENAAALPEALAETIYLHADEDRKRAATTRRLLGLARSAGTVDLLNAASALQWLADASWLKAADRMLRFQPNASDEYLLRQQTPQGEIVIGGTGRNVYRDMEPAVIIDLGGDDLYANGAGTAMGDARPVSVVIDLAGNDTYEGTDAFVQGCGVLGVGLLIDVAGDDRYLGKDGAQGVGLLGVGIVVDRAGHDRYRALHFAQGVGFFGLGAVIDEAGGDSYDALSQAQGLGLPMGVGLLHDLAGDDRYFAKGGAKTGYGTQGVFDGWSQGCGLGLRYLASGGFGLLADDAGADEYAAGNFSQGGGYFFGFGMLRDGGSSDDSYLGSRYGQGWAAHQAVGAFLEEGGDDTYETTHGVIAGLAWDQSVTWFCDRSGDDTYRGSFFSLGASAHNGVTIFQDDDGSDSYSGVEIARSGPNDYHGGTSFTLFLDLGSGRDSYEKGAPGRLQRNGEHGFALDLPGRLEDWAKPGALTALLDADAGRPAAPPASPAPARRRLGR